MGMSLCKDFGCCTKDSSVRRRRRRSSGKRRKHGKKKHSRQRRRSCSTNDTRAEPYTPATPRSRGCPDRRDTASTPLRYSDEVAIVSPMTDVSEGCEDSSTAASIASNGSGCQGDRRFPVGEAAATTSATHRDDLHHRRQHRTVGGSMHPEDSFTSEGGEDGAESNLGRPISSISHSHPSSSNVSLSSHYEREDYTSRPIEGRISDDEAEEQDDAVGGELSPSHCSVGHNNARRRSDEYSATSTSVTSSLRTDGDSGDPYYHHDDDEEDNDDEFSGTSSSTETSQTILTSESAPDDDNDNNDSNDADDPCMEDVNLQNVPLGSVWTAALTAAAAAIAKEQTTRMLGGDGTSPFATPPMLTSSCFSTAAAHRLPGCSDLLGLLPVDVLEARHAYRASTYNTGASQWQQCAPCPLCGVCCRHVRWCSTTGQLHTKRRRQQPNGHPHCEVLTSTTSTTVDDCSAAISSLSCCTLFPASDWVSARCFPLNVPAPNVEEDVQRCGQWSSLDNLVALIGSFAPDWCSVLEEQLAARCYACIDALVWSGVSAAGSLNSSARPGGASCLVDPQALRFVIRRGCPQQNRTYSSSSASTSMFPFDVMVVPSLSSPTAVGSSPPYLAPTSPRPPLSTFSARIMSQWKRGDLFTLGCSASVGVGVEKMTMLMEAITIVLLDRERSTTKLIVGATDNHALLNSTIGKVQCGDGGAVVKPSAVYLG